MILTEMVNYNEEEIFFIEKWKECKWVLWDKCPQSIFLVTNSFREKEPNEKAIRKFGRFIPTHSFCFELDWRGGYIKFSDFGLYMSELDNFHEIVSNLYKGLLENEMSNPKRNKAISDIRSKKKKIKKEEFIPRCIVEYNDRLCKLEKFLESNNYKTF